MRNKEPLKEILIATRPHWDHPQTRPAARALPARFDGQRVGRIQGEGVTLRVRASGEGLHGRARSSSLASKRRIVLRRLLAPMQTLALQWLETTPAVHAL